MMVLVVRFISAVFTGPFVVRKAKIIFAVFLAVARGTSGGCGISNSTERILQRRRRRSPLRKIGSITKGDQLTSYIFIRDATCNGWVRCWEHTLTDVTS